jgi:proteasome lid subunit RPN8/RPN11
MSLVDEMVQHAIDDQPNEACGFIVTFGRRTRLVRARNVAEEPRVTFLIDPEAWLSLSDEEQVVGIYHSHPVTSPEPSMSDRVGCEASEVPWHIVTPAGGYHYFEPSGYQAPYKGRPYVYGHLDCFTLVRDYYQREFGIELHELDRPNEWWKHGKNLYVEHHQAYGFRSLVDAKPEVGDIFLIQVFSEVPNHAAIYVGDQKILHHVQGRLSSVDVWGGMWSRNMTHHLRHESRMEPEHG